MLKKVSQRRRKEQTPGHLGHEKAHESGSQKVLQVQHWMGSGAVRVTKSDFGCFFCLSAGPGGSAHDFALLLGLVWTQNVVK